MLIRYISTIPWPVFGVWKAILLNLKCNLFDVRTVVFLLMEIGYIWKKNSLFKYESTEMNNLLYFGLCVIYRSTFSRIQLSCIKIATKNKPTTIETDVFILIRRQSLDNYVQPLPKMTSLMLSSLYFLVAWLDTRFLYTPFTRIYWILIIHKLLQLHLL